MKYISTVLLSGVLLSSSFSLLAQDRVPAVQISEPEEETIADPVRKKKIYLTSAFEGSMFSTAFIKNPNTHMGTLRYSLYWNLGANWNYEFSDNAGIFWGLTLKNLGFIEKTENRTFKHRTYNIGIPVGLKFGNLLNDNYFMIGGGVDFPIHYKNKTWGESRDSKIKGGEWFSDVVNPIMPYVFVGGKFWKMMYAKLQYYPTNFFNENSGIYHNTYDVNILSLNLGIDINIRPKY